MKRCPRVDELVRPGPLVPVAPARPRPLVFGPPVRLRFLATILGLGLVACQVDSPPPTARSGAATADLLLLGGTLITMDEQRGVIDDAGIAIIDGEIVAIGSATTIGTSYSAPESFHPRPHDLVIPGLINGHNHAAMTLLRGVADDLALMDWLQQYIFPVEAEVVDEEFVRVGTELAAVEMIATGTTTFTDMYYFEETAAEVVHRAGMRAILGDTVIGFAAPDHDTPQASLAALDGFIQRWKSHPRVTPAVAPHAPFTVAPEILRACAELARRHAVPLLIHLAETAEEVDQIKERYALSPTAHLQAIGFWGPRAVGAHAVWLNADDIDILARNGVGVIHNPESNMKLASGTMPLDELRSAGVPVGLGTDGAASNNDLDLFGAMTAAALLHKHARSDPTELPATDVVAMATIDGARALGMASDIGSLSVGKRADLVVIDGDAPSMARYDPYSHIAYAARGGDVRLTVVEGKVLYRDGRHTTLDATTIRQSARRLAAKIAALVRPPT